MFNNSIILLCKKFSSKIVFKTSEEWIFKTIFFFFNKRKARITYSDTEKNWLRNAGLHQQQLQSIQRWNAITVQSHRIENTTFDFENRHNKSRHLSEIILPFTFKLNRHQEEYRFEQVSSKK